MCCSEASANILFPFFDAAQRRSLFHLLSILIRITGESGLLSARFRGRANFVLILPCSHGSDPPVFVLLFLPNDHFNASGVINVVMITMITTAPKVAELITGSLTPFADGNISVAPIPANIRPTSPRGIIPRPIAKRLTPRSITPNAADLFADYRCER